MMVVTVVAEVLGLGGGGDRGCGRGNGEIGDGSGEIFKVRW